VKASLVVALLCALPCAVVVDETRARADEPVRHVVKAGDSCSSIAQHYYGDTRFVDLLHGANPELARKPPPHVLKEGMVLVIPPKPAPRTGPDAQLTAVQNQVDVLTPETKPGKANDPLFRGNRVSTQAASAADVTFRDETQVKLGERTLVIILGDARSAAARVGAPTETQTTLVTGNLRAFMAGVPPSPSSPRGAAAVATDAASVKIYDGEAQVSADAVKTTRLAVYRGSSAIDARGTRREVPRGFGSKAELGQQPTVPRPLPPAPVWTTPPPLVLLDRGTASIVGEYDVPAPASPASPASPTSPAAQPSPRVASWHVQIARDGIFRDIAVDTTAPAGVRRLEAQPPGAGRYYIRVSSVDDDHFEGPYGVIARVLVVKAVETVLPGARRRIEIEPPDAFCVRVGNVALTRVEGPILAGATEPVRLRCAPSESDPTTLILLD
jgi:phage tail protein X